METTNINELNLVPNEAENLKSSSKEAHRKYVNTGDFDMYSFSTMVDYHDRDKPCELIPLAAKRAAFRLKYPEGNIDISAPVFNDRFGTITATLYVPRDVPSGDGNISREYIPLASGTGFFEEPGRDCVNIYKAQDRALRSALNNAGFQGVTEGSETAGEGAGFYQIVYTPSDSTPALPGYPQPPQDAPIIVSNDDPALEEEKKSKGRKKSNAKKEESAEVDQTADDKPAAKATYVSAEVASALDQFVSCHGVKGKVGELLRTKKMFVAHLALQYDENSAYLSDEDKKMYGACKTVIQALTDNPSLEKELII